MFVTLRGAPSSVAVLLLLSAASADQNPTCHPKDFHYEFTECDKWGGRWRVSVPEPGSCTGGAPNAPVRVANCTTSCDAGFYFNATTLTCDACTPGTYSLGGGVAFDTWDTLPAGFHVVQEEKNGPGSLRDMLPSFRGRLPRVNCSSFGWKIHGDFIASQTVPCTSILVYTVRLVKPGQLLYTYQYTDESVVFLFQVQNDQCLSMDEAERSRWPPPTEEGRWRTLAIALKTGLNVLQWKTIGLSTDVGQRRASVLIKSIHISGLAYTSSCLPCPNGTFSGRGAPVCTDCPMNTYSKHGAGRCLTCDDGFYSEKGSSKCKPKQPCRDTDYYFVYDQCNDRKKTVLHYKWFEPKICDDSTFGARRLPPVQYDVDCPPCNPGMYYNNSTRCVFCPTNHYSNGQEACQTCPDLMAPNNHYEFVVWNELPPVMDTSCLSLSEGGCRSEQGWLVAEDHIHTSFGNADDAYLVLELKVSGFRTNQDGGGGGGGGRELEDVYRGRGGAASAPASMVAEVSRVTFQFELVCSAACEFLFMQESLLRGVAVVESWSGSQAPQLYTYVVAQNDTYVFSWAFQKRNTLEKQRKFALSSDEDIARIFWVNVSNTIDGGASRCHPCPKGIGNDGCIPCPRGHYVDENSTECRMCPNGTFALAGATSCLACGVGLQSRGGVACYSSCVVSVPGGGRSRNYNLTRLSGSHVVHGRRLFTSSGTEYFHVYNVSVCGDDGSATTICTNNLTAHGFQREPDVIRASMCRSTVLPMRSNEGGASLSAQSVSLGDQLLGITTDRVLSNISVVAEFVDPESHPDDLHFFYSSPEKTRACPRGRSSTVTLRCNASRDGTGTISVPTACPDGTCDGCSFHLLWETEFACPICTDDDDYEVVVGECSKGMQTVHYIATLPCRLPEHLASAGVTKRKCSSLAKELQISVALSSVVGLLLLVLVYYFWKKNQRLEYKYKKLVQSTSSKDGELPPAESCALHDDEEDHLDSVHYKESKSTIIFNKLKSIAGTKDCKNLPFESLELTDKDEVT